MRRDGNLAADTDFLMGDQVQLRVGNGQMTEVSATGNCLSITAPWQRPFRWAAQPSP